jgi:hypothetical protein
MIRIENKSTYKGDGFYVGRPSPLGNPFPIDAKTSRAKAINQYREWLMIQFETDDNPTTKAFMVLVHYYREHKELTLICWCAPLQCHAEVIRECVLAVSRAMDKNEQ